MGGSTSPLDTVYYSWVDNVHTSSSDLSVHGYWTKSGGTGTQAKVTVWLEVKAGDKWEVKKSNAAVIAPGGGRGKRVTVRYHCYPYPAAHGWRGRVDVDIIGEADGPEQAVSPKVKYYNCDF